MIALLLAVQTVASASPAPTERTPNYFRQPPNCASVVEQEAHRQHVALQGRRPIAQYAVFRRLEGCMVPTPMGYHPDYILPGAADPTVRREDAPSNRR